jgi:hypothetical protein
MTQRPRRPAFLLDSKKEKPKMLLAASQQLSSHWYTQDGAPRYGATLREARKEQLLPSFSTIKSILSNAGIERNQQQRIREAMDAMPSLPGEQMDQYLGRIQGYADQKGDEARSFGTLFHAAAESLHRGTAQEPDDAVKEHFVLYQEWFEANVSIVKAVEKVVVNPEVGYAGRIDLDAVPTSGGRALIDIKTQAYDKTPDFKREWILQLAAYDACHPVYSEFWSVVINSKYPCKPVVRKWTMDERHEAYKAFFSLIVYWQWIKNYVPQVIKYEE